MENTICASNATIEEETFPKAWQFFYEENRTLNQV
jgi:hypothetical protein